MDRLDVFAEELKLIKNNDLRDIVSDFIDSKVPGYFFFISASSTGKYHPSFSLNEGGLVRHTKMVVEVAKELMNLDSMAHSDVARDCVIASCILHDTFKHGYENKNGSFYEWTVESHPTIAADEWIKFCKKNGCDEWDMARIIYYCILKHMGQWGPLSATYSKDGDYKDSLASLVHLADYIASRKFFDMFSEGDYK